MIRPLSTVAAIAAILVVSAAAFAQADQRQRARASIDAATDALALSEEQLTQVREIRSARPPRGESRDEIQAWRDDQQAELAQVLTEDQTAKVAELEATREQMRALLGATMLGLAQTEREDREARFEHFRGDRGFGADRSWYRDSAGRSGRNQFNRGGSFGRGGGRFGPSGGFGRGTGPFRQARGGRRGDRD